MSFPKPCLQPNVHDALKATPQSIPSENPWESSCSLKEAGIKGSMREQSKTLGISSWIPPIQGKATPGTAPGSGWGEKSPFVPERGLGRAAGQESFPSQGLPLDSSMRLGCFGTPGTSLALLLQEVRLPGILHGHRETAIPGKGGSCTLHREQRAAVGIAAGEGRKELEKAELGARSTEG